MKQLTLIRHATATAYHDADSDLSRHLTAAGQAEARELGKHLAKRSLRPGHWYVSPASRTQETAQAIALALREEPSSDWLEPRIYLAESATLLALIQALPDLCTHALIIGHNPGITDLMRYLLARVTAPTLAPATCITLITKHATWATVGSGDFTLTERWTPVRTD